MRIGDHVLGTNVLRAPLMSAGGALHKLPLVAEQHVEIAHVPLGGVGLPRAFDAAGNGIDALAAAVRAEPTKAHRLDRRAFGLRSDMGCIASAVGLAEGMAASDQRHGLFVVHRHAGEGLAHVAARSHRIRVAVGALRVDVDQAHLHGGERVGQLAIAGIAVVAEPSVFIAPIDVFLGRPDVGATTAKAKRLEAHRFKRAISGQHKKVGP